MITLLNLSEAKTLTFEQLVNENPTGLLEIRKSLTFKEYRDQFGFDLKSGHEIFKSKHLNTLEGKDWYKYPATSENSLKKVFDVSVGGRDNIVYVVETIYPSKERVYCHLILTNLAYKTILENINQQQVIKVEQFYYDVLQKQFVEIY